MARCKLSHFMFHFPLAPLMLMRSHVPVVNAWTRRDAAIFSSSGHRVRPPRRRTCSVAFPIRLACASSTRWAPKANTLINLNFTASSVLNRWCPAMAAPLCPPWTPLCTWSCLRYPVSYLNRRTVSRGIGWWRRYRCWCRRRRDSPPIVAVAIGFDWAWWAGPPCQLVGGEGDACVCEWAGRPVVGPSGLRGGEKRKTEMFFFFLFWIKIKLIWNFVKYSFEL
jgi:hypothetical protein